MFFFKTTFLGKLISDFTTVNKHRYMKVDHLRKASIFPMGLGQHLGLFTKIALFPWSFASSLCRTTAMGSFRI